MQISTVSGTLLDEINTGIVEHKFGDNYQINVEKDM